MLEKIRQNTSLLGLKQQHFDVTAFLGFCLLLLFAFSGNKAFAQTSCANPQNIPGIPYNMAGFSTCNQTNNYNGNTACFSDQFFGGRDYLFRYTPSVDQCVQVKIAYHGEDRNESYPAGMAIMEECPQAGTNCIDYRINRSDIGSPSSTFSIAMNHLELKAGQTYYIVVASGSEAGIEDCRRFDISVSEQECLPDLSGVDPDAVDCGNNVNFELGNMSNWEGAYFLDEQHNYHPNRYGACCALPDNDNPPYTNGAFMTNRNGFSHGVNSIDGGLGECPTPTQPGIINGTYVQKGKFPSNTAPRQTVTSGGFDPNTDNEVPVVAPNGGNHSVRLGNHEAGWGAECMWSTFQVTRDNALFNYMYAVGLQDPPGHIDGNKPRFVAEVLDAQTNQIVDCGNGRKEIISINAVDNFDLARNPCDPDGSVWYQNWKEVSVNLTKYIGQNVTVRFCTADCGMGGHFGYAYVDAYCTSSEERTTNSLCFSENAPVTLTAPGGGTNYEWHEGDENGPVVGTSQTLQIDNPADGSYYTVSYTSGDECSEVFAIHTDTLYTVALTATIDKDTSYCISNKPDFIDFTTTINGNFNSIQWTSEPAGFTSTERNPSVPAPTENTTYTVRIEAEDGCFITETVEVEVYQPPVADFDFPTGCVGNGFEAQFTDRSTGNNIVSWLWDFGNGNTSTEQNPVYTFNDVGPHTITLTVMDTAGCSDVSSQELTLTPKPTAAFEYAGDCTTPEVEFTDQSSGNAINRLWDFGDGATSTEENPVHTYNSAGNYTVRLIVTEPSGCADTAVANISTDDLFMDFSFETSCDELVVPFTANGSSSIDSWQWNFGDGNTSSNPNPVHTYSDYGSYTVSLEVTTSEGCSDTIQKPLTLTPGPVADFTQTGECGNFEVQFTDNSSGSIESRQWDFGDGNISTVLNPAHTYSSEGEYTVTLVVIDSFGCSDTAQSNVSINDIFVDFNYEISCDNVNVDFLPTVSQGITSWLWDFGDGNTSTERSPSHEYESMGNYTVTLIVADNVGCVDTATQLISIDEPCEFEVWFPNAFTPDKRGGGVSPNNRARVRGSGIAELEIRIFDRWGELVYYAKDVGEAMNNGWDGTFKGEKVDVDSYAWYLTAKPSCCINDEQEELFMKGSLTLLR